MFCPKCGNEVKPGAKFCAKCGAPQEAPSVSGQTSQESGSRQPVSQGSAKPGPVRTNPSPEPVKPNKKKGKGLLVALLILLILAGLGAGGFAAYRLGVFDSLLDPTSRESSVDPDDEDNKKKDSDEEEDSEEEGDEETSDEKEEKDRKEETEPKEEESGKEEETESKDEEETGTRETTEAEKIKLSELLSGTETAPSEAETSPAAEADPPADPAMPSAPEGSVPAESAGDYVIPDSSTRRIAAADLEGLTKDQLKIARNEIYARHGRKFDSEVLQFYFNSKSWYQGTIEASAFSEDLLSQVEKDNINLIKAKEESMP